MSIDLSVLTPALAPAMTELIKSRFQAWGMEIKFHPDFNLQPETSYGFIPLKLRIPGNEMYEQAGPKVMTGFELYTETYNPEEDEILQLDQKQTSVLGGLWNRFTGRKSKEAEPPSPETAILRRCRHQTTIIINSSDTASLRAGMYFSIALAEIANGIIYEPHEDRYFLPSEALDAWPAEVQEYEKSLSSKDIHLEKFSSWD